MIAAVPRVSVVMSVYNGLPLLRAAVDSILAQTFGDFEFIIVNDGSTDGTLEYLRSLALADDRVRIVDQANSGLTKALIAGVAVARAPLIARMDADDLSHPERLERQVALLDARPDYVAANCGIAYVDGALETISTASGFCPPETLPLFMAIFNTIGGHGQMVFRKATYVGAGGYDPGFRYAQDYDLWTRMLGLGPIGEAPGILYRFRIDHDSISSRHRDEQLSLAVSVARREYLALTGVAQDEAVAGLLFDLWFRVPGPASASPADLRAADRAMRRCWSAFFHQHPELSGFGPQTKARFAEMWLNLFQRMPHSPAVRYGVVAPLVARWSPGVVLAALTRRVRGQGRGVE